MKKIIHHWHSIINMPKQNLEWHKSDVADEMQELEEAEGLIHKWSELSDVVYTLTRAHWSGHETLEWPMSKTKFFIGSLYMFPKYTLRWKFYRVLGKKMGKDVVITEVRNPKKIEKLEEMARRNNLDPKKFTEEAKKLMKWWIFLK